MQILNGRRHRVEEVAFSHCGRWLAAAGSRGGLHLWDTTNSTAGAKLVALNKPRAAVRNLAFRPDGRLFCTAWDGWFVVDPETTKAKTVATQKYGTYVASPDGTRVARTRDFTPIRGYRVDAAKATAGPNVSAPRTHFGSAAFSPDGTTFAVAEASYPTLVAVRSVSLREADTGKRFASLPSVHEHCDQLLFSPDGSKLLARSGAGLACWTVAEPEKKPRKASNPSRKHFISMACHPDGAVLTVDNDRLVRVWDVGTMTPTRAIEWNVGKLYAVAVSPDGTRAAVGSHTGKVLVWDWDG